MWQLNNSRLTYSQQQMCKVVIEYQFVINEMIQSTHFMEENLNREVKSHPLYT